MYFYSILFHNITDADTEEDTSDAVEKLADGEKKLSENIVQMLEHFKQEDPVGLPGADIPDPYPVPDMKQSLQLGTLYFKNTAVHGISKFRILYVNAEIGAMEVTILGSIFYTFLST